MMDHNLQSSMSMIKHLENIPAHLEASRQSNYDTKEPVLWTMLLLLKQVIKLLDSEGRRAIDLTSGGKAFVLQKGIIKEVEWKNQDGRMLPYENGLPMKLVPGKTWINIVPKMSIVYNREIGLVRWNIIGGINNAN